MFIKYLVFVFKYLSRVFGTTLATTHTFLERNASYIFWTREYVIGFEKKRLFNTVRDWSFSRISPSNGFLGRFLSDPYMGEGEVFFSFSFDITAEFIVYAVSRSCSLSVLVKY